MKEKSLIILSLLGMLLTSCGGSQHPLVGRTFTLDDSSPIESYPEGYTREKFFQLLGTFENNVSSIEGLNAKVKTFFGEGFIKISDTFYEKGYLAYNTQKEDTLFAVMVPSDDKGIDSESMNMTLSSGKSLLMMSGSYGGYTGSASFDIIAYSFIKTETVYSALFLANYYVGDTKDKKSTASFTYLFSLK